MLLHIALCQIHFHSPDRMDHQQWDKAGKRFFSCLRDEKVLNNGSSSTQSLDTEVIGLSFRMASTSVASV